MKSIVVILLALASPVHAEDNRPWFPRVSGGVGVGFWLGDIGTLTPVGGTVELRGVVEITPMFHVRALVEHAFLVAHDDALPGSLGVGIDGAALALHHPIFVFDPRDSRVSGDMHVLAGGEYERIRWDAGGLRRVEALVGFGGTIVVHDKQRRHPQQRIEYGVRMLFARAPDPDMLPVGCEGACDFATRPIDRTLIMEASWQYGR